MNDKVMEDKRLINGVKTISKGLFYLLWINSFLLIVSAILHLKGV
jgi:hypothetical protein